MTVEEAIALILSDRKAYATSLNYAVNYCRAAQGMTGEELKVQVLYILNNIAAWRHPEARQVRAVLRQFVK
jgi:hypothetical protein